MKDYEYLQELKEAGLDKPMYEETIDGIICVGEIPEKGGFRFYVGDELAAIMATFPGATWADVCEHSSNAEGNRATHIVSFEDTGEEPKNWNWQVDFKDYEYFQDLLEAAQREDMMVSAKLSEAQLSELDGLGYSLSDAYYAVISYTDGFVAKPNFEITKKALEIHKDSGERPCIDWYMSGSDDAFYAKKMEAIYKDQEGRNK